MDLEYFSKELTLEEKVYWASLPVELRMFCLRVINTTVNEALYPGVKGMDKTYFRKIDISKYKVENAQPQEINSK